MNESPHTRNAPDNVHWNDGSKSLMSVKRSGAGYVGTVAMGVSRS